MSAMCWISQTVRRRVTTHCKWSQSRHCPQRERLFERVDHLQKVWRQPRSDEFDDGFWHLSVERLGDASSNCGLRVAVTTEGHGEANRILDAIGIQKGHD